MGRTLIAWDIENIGFKNYNLITEKLGDIELTDKFFTHSEKSKPLKPEDSNFLTKRKWSKFIVKKAKDSADNFISDMIKNNLGKYDRFVIITGDNGFSNIISYLLKSEKEVLLIHNEKSSKLLNNLNEKKTIPDIHSLLTTFSI